MPRLIFKCPYIRGGSQRTAAHLSNYIRYMATREGAQKFSPDQAKLPATEKQRELVAQLVRDFPLSRGTFEYEDYQTNPTRGNASEFISRALEDNYNRAAKKENYVQYIAGRPRAQRRGSHALFTGSDESLTLSQVAEEIAHHPGNVWLPIISLRREDAARLGYDDARRWKDLLTGCAMEMAQAMKIPWDQFRWYAAFHDADGRSGYLTKDGITQIKSGLAKEIFRNELTELYRQQTQRRDDLTQRTSQVMEGLVQQMETGTLDNPRLERLMEHLAEKLKNLSGKKQYGYLKAPLKAVVDEIVDELARDPRVAQAYDLWYELREEVLRTYKNDLPVRLPLSRQKEFKPIKNMVIREAVRLEEITELFAPDDLADEPDFVEADAGGDPVGPKAAEHAPSHGGTADEPPRTAMLWSARYRQACRLRYDPNRTGRDLRRALSLFQKEAAANNPLAMYELGRMYAEGLGCIRNKKIAREWYPAPGRAYRQLLCGRVEDAEKERLCPLGPDAERQRPFGQLPSALTQNVKDLLASREIEAILDNTDFMILLSQAQSDRAILAKQLGISEHQLSYITHSNSGEGLLFYGDVTIPFVDRFPRGEIYNLLTTRPEDLKNEAKTE